MQEKFVTHFAYGFYLLKMNKPQLALKYFNLKSNRYKIFKLTQNDQLIFKNIYLDTEGWIIFDNDTLITRNTSDLNPSLSSLIKSRITSNNLYAIVKWKESVFQVDKSCAFLGGDDNYCHWFLRYLLRLADIAENTFLLVTENLKDFQLESLLMLGVLENRLIKVPSHSIIFCKELLVTHNPRRNMKSGIAWIRKKLLPSQKKGFRKLYISRADAAVRFVINEQEVRDFLVKEGFEVILASKISFKKQVEIFSEASIIVGAHGAGLTNFLFAPENCRVIELSDILIEHMNDFELIASSIPLRYQKIVSEKVNLYPDCKIPQRDHDFEIDLEKLSSVLLN